VNILYGDVAYSVNTLLPLNMAASVLRKRMARAYSADDNYYQ